MGFINRIQHGWDAFMGRDPTPQRAYYEAVTSYRPDRAMFSRGNERSIVTSVYNRISMDAASIEFMHATVDEQGNFVDERDSRLNNCLKIEANIDQTGTAFIQDVVMSMLDEGCVAIVPTVTTTTPKNPGAFDIEQMRAAKIIEWSPLAVKIEIYNHHTGKYEQRWVQKQLIGIVENPFYEIMNEPNSTLKRLIRKLALLDNVDEQNGAGKLDLIIQLPYVIKTPSRREQAESRRKDIEMQLSSSKFGIAYTDGTERITQLNRAVDNTLPTQVLDLKTQFYTQLSITEQVMNGTATPDEMQNYYTRTIVPIVKAITEEMTRKFLTKTARSQGQRVIFFRDPFELVPVTSIADIADRFTRNEILSSNEMRAIIGYRPVDTPEANALLNKNMNQAKEKFYEQQEQNGGTELPAEEE